MKSRAKLLAGLREFALNVDGGQNLCRWVLDVQDPWHDAPEQHSVWPEVLREFVRLIALYTEKLAVMDTTEHDVTAGCFSEVAKDLRLAADVAERIARIYELAVQARKGGP